MSDPDVTVRIAVHEFNGDKGPHGTILVESHPIFTDRVVLVAGGNRYTVIATDLADAAQRARRPR